MLLEAYLSFLNSSGPSHQLIEIQTKQIKNTDMLNDYSHVSAKKQHINLEIVSRVRLEHQAGEVTVFCAVPRSADDSGLDRNIRQIGREVLLPRVQWVSISLCRFCVGLCKLYQYPIVMTFSFYERD